MIVFDINKNNCILTKWLSSKMRQQKITVTRYITRIRTRISPMPYNDFFLCPRGLSALVTHSYNASHNISVEVFY
jgi:hypothetical protein